MSSDHRIEAKKLLLNYFKAVAKKWKGTAAGEKAQFTLAETEYKQGRLFAAHDGYEQLMADYPGTELNGKVVQREYEIAKVWFDQIDPKAGWLRRSSN